MIRSELLFKKNISPIAIRMKENFGIALESSGKRESESNQKFGQRIEIFSTRILHESFDTVLHTHHIFLVQFVHLDGINEKKGGNADIDSVHL